MGVIERILSKQLERGWFDNEEAKVAGIAQLAVDNGFNTLSQPQQNVLLPFLSQRCSGYRDPGGHNECAVPLEDERLLEAYEEGEPHGELMCEACRAQVNYDADLAERIAQE